jgi:hypothetical protein
MHECCRKTRPTLIVGVCLLALPLIGLVMVRGAEPEPQRVSESPITDADRDHWSFLPLVRPDVPAVNDVGWVENSIDRFILARLERKELTPQPQADRVTLIRRVTFDLTGLPTTPEEVAAFAADNSPDAYSRLVDRLLASHQYGERWAQHWLDLARFAETDGFEHDNVRPNAWRYRDWVIDALNHDLPYDRFVQLQLAADELLPDDKEAAVAIGFCIAGPDMPDVNVQDERKHHLLNEITSTVGAAFIAMQVGCAQCHDHKFDPISQADFYRLRAIFEPSVHVQKDKSITGLREYSNEWPVSHVMQRGDWRRPGAEVSVAFPRVANPWNDEVPAAAADVKSTGRRSALARWLTRPDHPLTTRVIANRLWLYHFGHGLSATPSDFGIMGDEPTHPELLDWLATELVRQGWSMKHMHRLIVTSATYRQASRPASPEWSNAQLAAARENWQHAKENDPDNVWLSRFPRQRLEGETIRDAMLAASGVLNLQAGGESVLPPLPGELVATLLKDQWKVSPDPQDHFRRSIYIFARRNLRYPIFDAFDRPDANASCPQRGRSTTAPQSLLMINSEFSLTAARQLAGYVLTHSPPNADDQITLAFRRALCREPSDDERQIAVKFLVQQQQLLKQEGRSPDQLALPVSCPTDVEPYLAAALTDFCLALFNSSEFIYVD